jgi:REP element-mobilizing transposase RayT
VLVTLKLRDGLRTLRCEREHDVVKRAFAACSKRGDLRVIEYSVLSNHLHVIAEASDERRLARGMLSLSVRIARGLNQMWKRAGRVFADRYHARILTTPRAVRTALVYCIQNARKHGSWLAKMPDVFSSGPWFDGWKSVDRRHAHSSRWLARARTWLLSIGWRRHGLIDPCESPAPGSGGGAAARRPAG